ncbi:MAG TPA: DNA alkylation repair protein, partial [Methanomassiliicoccales archaeon]|nr:DNA alkylation repair protein [Methanomassiliicoccales archaeon]
RVGSNMSLLEVMSSLEAGRNEANRLGMARFGIVVEKAYGVSIKDVRYMARQIGMDHGLAVELWMTEVHEARILATIVDDPSIVERQQMESWAGDFYSWDLCDQCCSNLFVRTKYARDVIPDWCGDEREFVRRAGFVMMAALAVKDKNAPLESFLPYIDLMRERSTDQRNNVRKAVNWAIRQIGKRSLAGREMVMPLAEELSVSKDRTARWIGKDAVRELNDPKILHHLQEKQV